MEKSSFENKPLAVKKETKVVKTKKKKQKIKIGTTEKTKNETITDKRQGRRKRRTGNINENTAIINILTKK